jgi:hypothetical protein
LLRRRRRQYRGLLLPLSLERLKSSGTTADT